MVPSLHTSTCALRCGPILQVNGYVRAKSGSRRSRSAGSHHHKEFYLGHKDQVVFDHKNCKYVAVFTVCQPHTCSNASNGTTVVTCTFCTCQLYQFVQQFSPSQNVLPDKGLRIEMLQKKKGLLSQVKIVEQIACVRKFCNIT